MVVSQLRFSTAAEQRNTYKSLHVTVTVVWTVAAEVPWKFLAWVCLSAPEACKALLLEDAGGEAPALPELLGKALEHAAALLHETAVNETHVSIKRLSCKATRDGAHLVCPGM
jgi:hypothetical protein